MTKNSNFEELSEEELKELLEQDDEDMVADQTDEIVDSKDAILYKDKEDKIDRKSVV